MHARRTNARDHKTTTHSAFNSPHIPPRLNPTAVAAKGSLPRLFALLLLLMLPAAVQAQFNYTTNEGTITITGYTGPGGEVTIPDTIDGLPVTSIGRTAFYNSTSLLSIAISDSVTNIGELSFLGCVRLTNVVIPKNVRSIGSRAFNSCSSLDGFTVDAMNPFYSSVDGILFDKSQSILVQYPNGRIQSDYSIPTNVAAIGDYAFIRCAGLKNVTIGSDVGKLGEYAFKGCSNLTSITIPDSVTNIGGYAFQLCVGLTNVTIGNGVSDIGNQAFSECYSLPTVKIPNSVTNIGLYPFGLCFSLTEIVVEGQNTAYSSVDGALFNKAKTVLVEYPTGKVGGYAIPGGVASIGNYAFDHCTNLTGISMPESVTSIGYGVFFLCASLGAITVDTHNPVFSSSDGVLFNTSGTTLIQFPGGRAGAYMIPGGVTSVASDSFTDCINITNVTIPASVTNFGYSMFSRCSSLAAITVDPLSPAFSSLDGVLFDKYQTNLVRCPGAKSGDYRIPDSVSRINDYSFDYCPRLTSVTIPAAVRTIGHFAFLGCPNLASVYFEGDAPVLLSTPFTDHETLYYLPGAAGWPQTLSGRPTAVWNPAIQTTDASFGVRSNEFGFNIKWASDMVVTVEACTNLATPVWSAVGTNTLTDGSSYFSDPQWTNHPARFYRLRSP